MTQRDLKGLFSALLVPFDAEGNLKEQGLRQLVRHNIDHNKMDGLYVGGSTGENFLLSLDEKKRIFEIAKDEAKGDCTLIAQVGSLNIKEAKELAKFTTDLGYDALSAVTPFYYKFSFAEIKDYYNTILDGVDNRMIIYSVPVLTGVNMGLEQFGELFTNPKVVGVKFTQADFYLLERLRTAFPDKLIWAGFDEMLLPALSLNVDGAIGSTYNVNGVRAREIYDLAKAGDFAKALVVQSKTNDFITDVLANGLYPTLKLLLQEAGLDAGYCRQPMGKANEAMEKRAKEIYQKYFA